MNIEQGISNEEGLELAILQIHFDVHHSLFDIRYSRVRGYQVRSTNVVSTRPSMKAEWLKIFLASGIVV